MREPLILENHSENYNGPEFLTILQFHKQPTDMMIVDNIIGNKIYGWIIHPDMNKTDEELLFRKTQENWKLLNREPMSAFLAKQNLIERFLPYFKVKNIDYLLRVIGPFPDYDEKWVVKNKKRIRK